MQSYGLEKFRALAISTATASCTYVRAMILPTDQGAELCHYVMYS